MVRKIKGPKFIKRLLKARILEDVKETIKENITDIIEETIGDFALPPDLVVKINKFLYAKDVGIDPIVDELKDEVDEFKENVKMKIGGDLINLDRIEKLRDETSDIKKVLMKKYNLDKNNAPESFKKTVDDLASVIKKTGRKAGEDCDYIDNLLISLKKAFGLIKTLLDNPGFIGIVSTAFGLKGAKRGAEVAAVATAGATVAPVSAGAGLTKGVATGGRLLVIRSLIPEVIKGIDRIRDIIKNLCKILKKLK